MICLVVVGSVALGQAALDEGLGDVTRELEPVFGEEEGTIETYVTADVKSDHMQEALLGLRASLAATALLGLSLSSKFDHVVAALCVAHLLFAGLKFADVVLSLPREALEGIYAWYPDELRELTGMLGRALNGRWDEALLPEGRRLALITGFLAMLLGIRIYTRRDLQVQRPVQSERALSFPYIAPKTSRISWKRLIPSNGLPRERRLLPSMCFCASWTSIWWISSNSSTLALICLTPNSSAQTQSRDLNSASLTSRFAVSTSAPNRSRGVASLNNLS